MKITNKYVFFWDGIYSQWYSAPMVIDDRTFNCCEQWMMYNKATFFEDYVTAEQVMKTKSPREQKELGRMVKNFDSNRWNKVCSGIVYKGNLAKFTQNEDLKKELLNTGNRILVEASPYDQIWGIGMGVEEEGIDNAINWKGQNLLGWALQLVKQELQNE
jgi:ribA/ribD-fused uncharacterized protein